MCDPRCRREMLIRGGLTATMAMIAYVILEAAPWVLILPVAVVALVWLKWRIGPRDGDGDADSDHEHLS
jgi:hypothetical protein